MTRPLLILGRRRFATVVIGEGVSMIGDAAFEIALAWTVLRLTGSISALAVVLLFQAVPRGVLLLLGGAVVDRHSARAVMIVAHGVRAVALAVVAFIAATGTLSLWHLAGLALVMGVSAAFFSPASESIVPSLVERDELAQANAVRGLFEQTALIVGPVIGGVVISVASIWVVLGFNALTFVVAAFTLLVAPKSARASGGALSPTEILRQIGEGLGHARRSHEVRLVLIVISAATLSYSGVFAVGLPVLATSMGGASALGLMVAGWGAGQLVGALAAAVTGLPRRWGLLIIGMTVVEAAMFTTLGLVSTPWTGAGLLFLTGIGVSYSSDVALPTFIQTQTPRHLLGRINSVIGLPRVVFEPVSISILGLALSRSTSWGFGLAALPVLVAGVVLACDPRARALSTHPVVE
ncbi:MAG: MFS transporter [Humibacillus sp.]|nr:MFS transporter [Humibacillus sp.]MDN5780259.1 MFS transporter [Humibacillus sp.]